jgi:hypothetical protein
MLRARKQSSTQTPWLVYFVVMVLLLCTIPNYVLLGKFNTLEKKELPGFRGERPEFRGELPGFRGESTVMIQLQAKEWELAAFSRKLEEAEAKGARAEKELAALRNDPTTTAAISTRHLQEIIETLHQKLETAEAQRALAERELLSCKANKASEPQGQLRGEHRLASSHGQPQGQLRGEQKLASPHGPQHYSSNATFPDKR